MAEENTPQTNDAPAPAKSMRGCLGNCVAGMVICVVLCGGAGLWFVFWGKGYYADQVRDRLVTIIEGAEIDEAQKRAMASRLDRLVEDFKSGKISRDQWSRVGEKLAESPVLEVLAMVTIQGRYITPSGLSDEEKADARLTVQRINRGLIEERLSERDLEDALGKVSSVDSDGKRRLNDDLTDDEVRTFLATARDAADRAGISRETFEVDLDAELKNVIDRALAGD